MSEYRDSYQAPLDSEDTSQMSLDPTDPDVGDLYRDKRSGTFGTVLKVTQRGRTQWITFRRNDRVTEIPRHWLDTYWEKVQTWRPRGVDS